MNFYFTVSKRNREEEVKKVILDNDGVLKSFYKEKSELYALSLLYWFLKRYDLPMALKIIRAISDKKSTRNRIFRGFPYWMLLLTCLIFGLFFYSSGYLQLNLPYQFLTDFKINWLRSLGFFPIIESIIILFGLITWLIWMIDLFTLRNYSLLSKLILPRLLGGIIVGYLPLLFSQEVWDFANNVTLLEGTVIIGTALIFSLYYLFTEVNNIVQDARIAFHRGLRIWLIGLVESFFIGIFTQDLLARQFVKGGMDQISAQNSLLGGLIYPKILLLYFPLALLIGIFVQIIWEEKPITQPL